MFTPQQKGEFKGVGALVLTPFDENLQVDFEGLYHNVRYMIDNGLNASNGFLVAAGSMGECYSMNMDEKKQVIRTVVEAAQDDIPVIAGCNSSSIVEVVELARYAEEVRARAIMVVQPYYLSFGEDQIFSFYKFINDRVEVPIMIYNNPGVANGSDMSVNLLKRLADLDRIFALKQATSNIKRFFDSAEELSDKLLVFVASSSLQPFGALARTAGFFSSIASFNPQLEIQIWEASRRGDYEAAYRYHRKEMMIYSWWWNGGVKQPNGEIVHVKKAMDLVGLRGGKVRPPLLPITEEEIEGLKKILREWGLLQ
ncbi:MAG: 4-hydroxy-tetrahydrodipicolinate synthase [Candidatus Atribacteria bacterium]|nr:4-hydroxy-tetrahydrodipicolinate synthase [Candidatus Atribacteria bacterium]